jgi:hypothetical protein
MISLFRFIKYFFLIFPTLGIAEGLPSKSELNAVMQNTVKQMNAQMSGLKIDEYTTLKYVTYDSTPSLFTYFYSSSALSVTNQQTLTIAQITALNQYNINKTCTSKFKGLMKPYNLKVAHILEDSKTGKNFYKLTVSALDCQ